ncbi:MAG: efflux RND transporter periplasmic adaptor subunit, partial [Deltaproteobacteria bacterium]|nr:efflux RND transporter periplasmic adaptor subunit [Deltaproteobacteria bacterium]
ARVRQAEAELQVAKANVAIQKAAVLRCKAELENARAALSASEARTLKAEVALKDAGRDLNRKRALRDRTVISENEIDKAQAAYDQAMAQLRSLQAEQKARGAMVAMREAALRMAEQQVAHAQAQVQQREAFLEQCRTDLEHTVIRSPVTGVVIERSVDMGQTVAASLQAPTLFTIAKDLRDMQVEADIDEADIGLIKEGQKASFTVDAFPREEFTGFVTQIRKAPKPGMTANVNIVVDQRRDVLRVPNAALRFVPPNLKKRDRGHRTGRPSRTGLSPSSGALKERIQKLITVLKMNEQQQARVWGILADARRRIVAARMAGTSGRELDSLMAEVRAGSREAVKSILSPEQRKAYAKILEQLEGRRRAVPQRIWVAGPNGLPVARDILAGITDGTYTEVVRGDLSQGERVIVGIQQPGAGHGAL